MSTNNCSDDKKRTMFQDTIDSNIPLVTCAFLAALTTGGPTYAFGLYGGDLKESLELTQSQLDTLGASNFCAGLLSWIPGLMVDRLGVRFALVLGATSGACFMTLYWAVARQFFALQRDSILPTLCTLGVLIFMTNGLVIGSIFKLLVSTCAPHTKGSAVGAAKGYVGLGSGVYACLFRALKTPSFSDLDFLPLAAILAVLAGSLPALLLLPDKQTLDKILASTPLLQLDQTTSLHLRFLYAGLIVLATIVVGTTLMSLLEDSYTHEQSFYVEEQRHLPHYGRALMVVLAWLGPIMALLFLPAKTTKLHGNVASHSESIQQFIMEEGSNSSDTDASDDKDINKHQAMDELLPLIKRNSSAAALAYGAEITDSVIVYGPHGLLGERATPDERQTPEPDYNLQQMLQTTPAWLFVWIAVIVVGGGTMITNNMGQLVESLHLPLHTTTPASLALFSVAQAISRVLTGAVSDTALSWDWKQLFHYKGMPYHLQGLPRPAFLIVASMGSVIAHLFLSVAKTRTMFLIGVCFSGAAFGMIWPLMVLIVGEVFGTANMGANYMFYDGLSSALGTLLLSKYVTQEVYERHITGEEGERTCYGQECFFMAHIIIAVLSFTCFLASYWFYHSTRHVYAATTTIT